MSIGETLGLAAFLTVFLTFAGGILFLMISTIFAVRVNPGEIVVAHYEGSRSVVRVYSRPGFNWRVPRGLREVRLRIDEPLVVTPSPVEALTHDGMHVALTVRVTFDIIHLGHYIDAVIGTTFGDWQQETLPTIVARVVAGFPIAQVLNDRGQVAAAITAATSASFAGDRGPDLGLRFVRAAVVGAGHPWGASGDGHGTPRPKRSGTGR